MWKKVNIQITQILGDIWAPVLMGALFGITTVLFITLPISQTNDSTLGESIFGRRESPEEVNEELLLKAIGELTTDPAQN